MTTDLDAGRDRKLWALLRVALAGLLAAHGWARWHAGAVTPFGHWLDSQGVPFGMAVAVAVTAYEILGTPLLAWGRWFLLPITLLYAFIYTVGLFMVHATAGWFVVGLGRNGMEYSVLLIVCLLCVGLQQHGSRRA